MALIAALRSGVRSWASCPVTVHEQGLRRCGIVTFRVDGVPAAEVQRQLAVGGATSACRLRVRAL